MLFIFCEITGQALVWETISSNNAFVTLIAVLLERGGGGGKSIKYFYRMFRNVIHLVKTSVIYS